MTPTHITWQALAEAQLGLIARRQLRQWGITADYVRNQVRAGRWRARSSRVISTFTGTLTWEQRCWLGVLHAGPQALVGGLTDAELHGLERWHRDEVTIMVPPHWVVPPLPDIRFVRTRRPLARWRVRASGLPACQIEPALLLVAAYEASRRAGQGLLAAAVQQGLTTAGRLEQWVDDLRPLHRAPLFREALAGIAGGAQSLGELDINRMCSDYHLPLPTRQVRRRDASGRSRFTDCEWELPDGYIVVLEVDGGFHMQVEHWEDDMVRERGLADPRRMVLRCTTRELRDDPRPVVRDLRRLGVGSAVDGAVGVSASGAGTVQPLHSARVSEHAL